MNLPYDYARCANGESNCEKASKCARTQWPIDFNRVPVALFWTPEKECGRFIPRNEDEN